MRTPWLARVLRRLIVGEDAEIVLGDLEEAFQSRVRQRGDSVRTRVEHVVDVAATVGHWWWSAMWRIAPPSFATAGSRTLLKSLGGEMRHLIRGLIRRPGYSAIVIMTLALGIGATTTIYTVVDAMLVKPLPYRDSERLVVIGNTVPGGAAVAEREGLVKLETMSLPNVNLLLPRVRSVDRVATLERMGWITRDAATGETEKLEIAAVSENLLGMLGVKPLLGRLLQPGDTPANAGPNVVITHASWQRRFGGDANVIGKTTPGGATLTVVGVLPPTFQQPAALVGSDVEYWTYLEPATARYQQPRRRNLHVLARLAPGVNVERARRELAAAQAEVAREAPDGNSLPGGLALGVGVNSLRDETVGSAGRPALLILGASVLLLLLACTNASNLLLVRGLERTGEMAVRQAIGAARGRLTAGLVLESVTLSLAGGVMGLGIAAIGVGLFRRFGPSSGPLMADVSMNARVAAAGFLLAVVVGLAIGIIPAIRGGATDLLSNLRSSALAVTPSGSRLRATLAATQLALALILGVGASLLFRSFVQIRSQPLGFQPEHLVVFNLPLKSPRGDAWDRVIASLRTIPGVTNAGMTSSLPFQSPSWMPRVQRADQRDEISSAGIPGYVVTPTFFATAGIRLVNGRAFDETDQRESARVAIVNQTFAKTVLANRSPIGARITTLNEAGSGVELTVVGVVEDVVQTRIQDGIAPAIYVPHTQSGAIPQVVIASNRDVAALAPEIRRAIGQAGVPLLPLIDLGAMKDRVDATRVAPRFHALLIGGFAATAILLSAIGLYGTLAFAVRSRRKELGIRIALGATPEQIHGIVIRQSLLIFAVGGGAGLVGALAVTRLLEGYLYRLSPADPLSFLAAITTAGTVVVVAALLPVARAGKIDPMTSIRAEA